MLNSIQTRKVKDYVLLRSNEERLNFICESFGLKTPTLIGKIEINSMGKYKIKNFVNPNNGERIFKIAADAAKTEFVFCPDNEKGNLNEGDHVIFDFLPSAELTESRIRSRGNVIRISPGSIKKFSEAFSDFTNKINVNIEVSTLVKIDDNLNFKIYYINDLFNDFINHYLKSKNESFEKRESLLKKNTNFEKKQIRKKSQELIQFENKLEEIQKELLKKEEYIFEKINFLSMLGFNSEVFWGENGNKGDRDKVDPKRIEVNDLNIITLKQIQTKIYRQSRNKLVYDIRDLQNIIAAINTNQFTILHGSSGTGKTSLVSALAKSINANYKIVPVQSSWIDRQDLFGFFNPLSKMFSSTPFLDAILEASEEQNKSKLYLICLDELNLSQVEYYFADLLSLREHNENIPLYSEQDYNCSLEEVRWLLQKIYQLKSEQDIATILTDIMKINDKDQFLYIQRYKNLIRFKPNLTIPSNVRFVGTMNIDGTTKPLSPKVIDRSYFIELEKAKTEFIEELQVEDILLIPNDFEIFEEMNNMNKLKDNLLLNLQACKVEINPRTEKHLNQILYTLQLTCPEETDQNYLIDEVLVNKILPKINYYISNNDDSHISLQKKIEDVFGRESKSFKKISKMVKNSEVTGVFSYWG